MAEDHIVIFSPRPKATCRVAPLAVHGSAFQEFETVVEIAANEQLFTSYGTESDRALAQSYSVAKLLYGLSSNAR
jgi:hypothetical protein